MQQVFFNHTFTLNHAFSLEILSFYMCVSKTMIIWGTVPETWSETEFFVLLSNYWPRKLKFGKKCKKYLGIFWFYICVPQMTIIWCMLSEIWSTTDIIFVILGYFCPFTPLTTQKRKILKKWKKRMEMSFYKCAPWMTTIWCMIPEIWSTHNENNFSHFGPFFALLLP